MAQGTVCVIGAGGFIASWIVSDLLKKGYTVHATVQNPDDDAECGHLKTLEGAASKLKLFKADLLDYNSLVEAIRGCEGVFHTACPVFPKFDNPDDVLLPAIKGTENVMTACHELKIKRIVMTSSGAAVIGVPQVPDNTVLDESCWSDPQHCRETQDWYGLAKTESEKLAWDMSQDKNLNLVVVLPVLVLGPLLQSRVNVSSTVVKMLIDGSMNKYPNTYLFVVDVRDIAKVHILAYEKPGASGRYLCMDKVLHYREIVEIIKEHFPSLPCPEKCEDRKEEGLRPEQMSNKKVLSLVGEFIPVEQTIVDAVKSLIQHKCVLD